MRKKTLQVVQLLVEAQADPAQRGKSWVDGDLLEVCFFQNMWFFVLKHTPFHPCDHVWYIYLHLVDFHGKCR